MSTPEVQELIRLVEKKYKKKLNTTTDFDEFSLHLDRHVKIGKISPSTLKRLWGYVNDTHKPRVSTLNLLSEYIGHQSYDKFVEWLKSSSLYNSSFFTTRHISSAQLEIGDIVEIGWQPNRIVTLQYKGNSEYEVIRSINSKLQENDKFVTGCFIMGHPLYLPCLQRNGECTSSFIAGRNGGLTCLNILEQCKIY